MARVRLFFTALVSVVALTLAGCATNYSDDYTPSAAFSGSGSGSGSSGGGVTLPGGGSGTTGVTGGPMIPAGGEGEAHGAFVTGRTGPIISRTGPAGVAAAVAVDNSASPRTATLQASLLANPFSVSAPEFVNGSNVFLDGASVFFTARDDTGTFASSLNNLRFGSYAIGGAAGQDTEYGGYYYGDTPTDPAAITTATATYDGAFEGFELRDNGGSRLQIGGDVTIDMDFTTNAVTGNISNIAQVGASTLRGYSIDLNGTLSGANYSGTATVNQGGIPSLGGSMTGALFGATGEETGGALQTRANIATAPSTVVGGFAGVRR